jgi:hypothetical protein
VNVNCPFVTFRCNISLSIFPEWWCRPPSWWRIVHGATRRSCFSVRGLPLRCHLIHSARMTVLTTHVIQVMTDRPWPYLQTWQILSSALSIIMPVSHGAIRRSCSPVRSLPLWYHLIHSTRMMVLTTHIFQVTADRPWSYLQTWQILSSALSIIMPVSNGVIHHSCRLGMIQKNQLSYASGSVCSFLRSIVLMPAFHSSGDTLSFLTLWLTLHGLPSLLSYI